MSDFRDVIAPRRCRSPPIPPGNAFIWRRRVRTIPNGCTLQREGIGVVRDDGSAGRDGEEGLFFLTISHPVMPFTYDIGDRAVGVRLLLPRVPPLRMLEGRE